MIESDTLSLHERNFLKYLDARSTAGSVINYKNPFPYRKPSSNLVNASLLAFIGTVFFVIAFTSPYWLQSYEYTYNSFLNMGIWEFCFYRYRHFDFQYDKEYTGCDHVFSYEYQQIREWLLPPWLMATQAFMTIALICLTLSLVTLVLLLIRWPLNYVMKHEWRMAVFSFWCHAITSVCLIFSITIFGSMCWSRSWLLYPNFNYLSWSYSFAVMCTMFETFATLMLFHEKYTLHESRRDASNILPLQPAGSFAPIPLNYDAQSNPGYI